MTKKNIKVRIEMIKNNVNNLTLSKELGLRREAVSAMLRFELADNEQERLILIIHKIAGD